MQFPSDIYFHTSPSDSSPNHPKPDPSATVKLTRVYLDSSYWNSEFWAQLSESASKFYQPIIMLNDSDKYKLYSYCTWTVQNLIIIGPTKFYTPLSPNLHLHPYFREITTSQPNRSHWKATSLQTNPEFHCNTCQSCPSVQLWNTSSIREIPYNGHEQQYFESSRVLYFTFKCDFRMILFLYLIEIFDGLEDAKICKITSK